MHLLFARGMSAWTAAHAVDDHWNGTHPGHGHHHLNIPGWGVAIVVITTIFFLLASAAVSYTYGELIAALAMVESPKETELTIEYTDAADETDNVKTGLLDHKVDSGAKAAPPAYSVDQEVLTIRSVPLTSSLRSIRRHLYTKAGRTARFRGLHIKIANTIATGLLTVLMHKILPRHPIVHPIVSVVVAVLLCRIPLAWTMHVIAEPNAAIGKRFWRRVDRRSARKIAGPTLVYALAKQLAMVGPIVMANCLGLFSQLHDHTALMAMSKQERVHLGLKVLAVAAVAAIDLGLLTLPAKVMLTRVQASMLPDNEETIIPIDRSFDGKVVPEIVGGSGKLGMRDALRTMDRQAWKRVVKVYVKTFAMQLALGLMWMGIVGLEVSMLMHKVKKGKDEEFEMVIEM